MVIWDYGLVYVFIEFSSDFDFDGGLFVSGSDYIER